MLTTAIPDNGWF